MADRHAVGRAAGLRPEDIHMPWTMMEPKHPQRQVVKDTPKNGEIRAKVMEQQLGHAVVMLQAILHEEHPAPDAAWSIAYLRARLAEHPRRRLQDLGRAHGRTRRLEGSRRLLIGVTVSCAGAHGLGTVQRAAVSLMIWPWFRAPVFGLGTLDAANFARYLSEQIPGHLFLVIRTIDDYCL